MGSFHPKPYGHTAWRQAPPAPPSGSDSAARRGEPLPGGRLVSQGANGVLNSKKSGPSSVGGSPSVCACVCRYIHLCRVCSLKSRRAAPGMDSRGLAVWISLCSSFVVVFIFPAVLRWHIVLILFAFCKYFKH